MKVLRTLIILALPLLIGLCSIRLLMSDAFLVYEYGKPDFPPDPAGFTQADRLDYARVALEYIRTTAPISLLGDQRLPDGAPLYNQRELKHMVDVQILANQLLAVTWLAGIIVVGGGLALALRPETRPLLAGALVRGSVLTVLIILGIILLVLIGWNTFFVGFHNIFFESGTWQFAYTDTLIRLFPERFWFDVALLIGAGVLAQALVIGLTAWWWHRRLHARITGQVLKPAERRV
jgi:integral membrane protein (TIGR01906 family)